MMPRSQLTLQLAHRGCQGNRIWNLVGRFFGPAPTNRGKTGSGFVIGTRLNRQDAKTPIRQETAKPSPDFLGALVSWRFNRVPITNRRCHKFQMQLPTGVATAPLPLPPGSALSVFAKARTFNRKLRKLRKCLRAASIARAKPPPVASRQLATRNAITLAAAAAPLVGRDLRATGGQGGDKPNAGTVDAMKAARRAGHGWKAGKPARGPECGLLNTLAASSANIGGKNPARSAKNATIS